MMKTLSTLALAMVVTGSYAVAQNAPQAPAKIAVGATVEPSQVYDRAIGGIEREFVSLAEAIPADKWDYTPTQGDHKGVQSLGEMMKHVAQANMSYFGAVLGKLPSEEDNNKLKDAKGKDQILPLLKHSFEMGHQAAASLTAQNVFQAVATRNGNTAVRAGLMTQGVAHSFDHYGHLTEYARDLGMVPPSSQR